MNLYVKRCNTFITNMLQIFAINLYIKGNPDNLHAKMAIFVDVMPFFHQLCRVVEAHFW